MPAHDIKADAELIEYLARQAGAIALRYFNKDPQVWMKEGESPVSEADFAVDAFLKEKLLDARPDYGWLSEETADTPDRLRTQRTFIVDPIDGTRGFIKGEKTWCISIAVVENNRPTAGVLECPALDETITAVTGLGAHCNGRALLPAVPVTKQLRTAGPRVMGRDIAAESDYAIELMPFVPSLAYRLAMVALGSLDLALARASAKDWDLAAADLIVGESGAALTGFDGNALLYNCEDVRHGTLIAAHAQHHNELLDLTRDAINKQAQ
ncbi:MAG: 3'(2'),5'-bisphosphate nucleotidase CysQ [Pseudomonadota bacterium]